MFGANQTLDSHIGELPSASAMFHYRLRTITLNYFCGGIFYSVFPLSFMYSEANQSFISYFRVPPSSSAVLYYKVCGQGSHLSVVNSYIFITPRVTKNKVIILRTAMNYKHWASIKSSSILNPIDPRQSIVSVSVRTSSRTYLVTMVTILDSQLLFVPHCDRKQSNNGKHGK